MSESKQPKFNLKTVNILAESKHRVLEVEMLRRSQLTEQFLLSVRLFRLVFLYYYSLSLCHC